MKEIIIKADDRVAKWFKEVIRCKECKHCKIKNPCHDYYCELTNKKVWITHFCGYGERSEITNE